MRLLLDTCTFLWLIWNSKELSDTVLAYFHDPSNEIFLSVVSAWEIGVKYRLGKLSLPDDPGRLIPQQRKNHRIFSLPLDENSALQVIRLPNVHRDPFDRMLISQAITEGMAILTPDPMINQYPLKTIW